MKKFLLSLFSLMMVAVAAHADKALIIANGATYDGDVPAESRLTLPDGTIVDTHYALEGVVDFYLTKINSSSSQVNTNLVRWYANDKITLTPASGVTINSVSFKCGNAGYGKAAVTVVADGTKVAGGLPANEVGPFVRTLVHDFSKSMELTNAAQVRFAYIEIEYTKSAVTPDPDPTPDPGTEATTVFEETFASSLGQFVVENSATNDASFAGWRQNGKNPQCAIANSYVNGKNVVADSWLVSPVLDLTKVTETALSFDQAFGFYFPTAQENFCKLMVREEGAADWTQLTITVYPAKKATGNWTDFATNTFDLKAYDGKKIQIAFQYINDGNQSIAWEIQNFKVTGKVEGGVEPDPTPEITEYDGIKAFFEAQPATEAKINGPLTAIYNNGRYLYVKDSKDAFGLIYNANDITAEKYVNGDQIASVNGTYKENYSLPEVIPASFGEKSSGTPVEPTSYTIDELSINMLSEYVRLENVSITAAEKDNNYTISDGENTIVAFNQYYNSKFYDVLEIPVGEGFTVDGFIGIYQGNVQFLPIAVTGGKVMETVATPVFSLESGKVAEGTKVAISCETEGAAIYYTVDGTTPTTASDLYAGEIAITDPVTIKAIAAKEGMLDSEVATATFTVAREGEVEVTFDFTSEEAVKGYNPTLAAAEAGKGTDLDGKTLVNEGISLTFAKAENTSNAPMWWHYRKTDGSVEYTEARVYINNTMTITAPEDKLVSTVSFTQNTGSTNWLGDWAAAFGEGWSESQKTYTHAQGVKSVSIVVPGNSRFATMTLTLVNDPDFSAISDIDADNANAPVEYFNLQGIRVDAENLTPGIYVRRQGSEVVKVLVK